MNAEYYVGDMNCLWDRILQGNLNTSNKVKECMTMHPHTKAHFLDEEKYCSITYVFA